MFRPEILTCLQLKDKFPEDVALVCILMDWQEIYMNLKIKPTTLMYSLAKMLNRKVLLRRPVSKINTVWFSLITMPILMKISLKEWSGITQVNTPGVRVVNLILLI